jgi:hypothetical protein
MAAAAFWAGRVVTAPVEVGFGRIVVLEIEAPNIRLEIPV